MDKTSGKVSNIVLVSNRLPFIIKKNEDGYIEVEKGAGGLVTAMAPVLRNRNGTWIGWPGYVEEDDDDGRMLSAIQSATSGYSVKPVMISAEDLKNFYEGFSNSIIWPLFHDSTNKCIFLPQYWKSYKEVNQKFALIVSQNTEESDFLWVHDYQLILVGAKLRKLHMRNQIGFFLHIPFPPIDTFARCPWRFQILSALLKYDIIGFQTIQDKRNFIGCLKRIVQYSWFDTPKELNGAVSEFTLGERSIRIGVFPISIDYNEFYLKAKERKVFERAKEIRKNSPDSQVLLGVDRLDYTKGIPEKLKAYQRFLTLFPEFHKKVHLIQLVVPNRREITAYVDLKLKIEQLVGEINGEFAADDWLPVQYLFRALDRTELTALYRAAEIAFVTPLKDGMNLVCKEYCASNVDGCGILILSEFAGAAQQFYKDAILVNPHDIEGTARTIYRALNLVLEKRRRRMHNLRENVKNKDIFWWLSSFINAAIDKDLSTAHQVDDYFPVAFIENRQSKSEKERS